MSETWSHIHYLSGIRYKQKSEFITYLIDFFGIAMF